MKIVVLLCLFVCCCRRDIIFVKFFTPALENILGGTTVQPHTTPFTAINDRCVKGELTGWCGFPSIIILIIICGIASVGQCHFDTGMLSGRCHSRNVPHDKPDAASISMHFNSFCGWILETEKKTKEVKVGPWYRIYVYCKVEPWRLIF